MTMLYKDVYKRFGEMIKKYRIAMNLTQEDLGRRVDLSRASIANIEVGRQKVALHQVYVFAKQLNISPEELLLKDDEFVEEDYLPVVSAKKDQEWVSAILKGARRA